MPHENKMGQRASDTAPVVFENCRIPKANCVVEPGKGWAVAMKTLDYSRPMVAAAAFIAQRCLDESIGYAKSARRSANPSHSTRALVKSQTWPLRRKRPAFFTSGMALRPGIVEQRRGFIRQGCCCRLGDGDCRGCRAGLWWLRLRQEYPVEKLMRDAKLIQIYEGTSQIQRLIITRELFR